MRFEKGLCSLNVIEKLKVLRINWRPWFLAMVSVMFCGLSYRLMANRIGHSQSSWQNPAASLYELPLEIGPWLCNSPADTNTSTKGNLLERVYTNKTNGTSVKLIIKDKSYPLNIYRYGPEGQYLKDGWTFINKQKYVIVSRDGKQIPCLVYHFQKSVMGYQELVVLTFHVINGRVISSETLSSDIYRKTMNSAGGSFNCLIQINSKYENAVHQAAADFADMFLANSR